MKATRNSERLLDWLMVAGLAALAVAANPLLFQNGLPIDERLTFYLPHHVYDAYWFARGYVPLWNFHSFFGSPEIATHQFAFFHLPNRILNALFEPVFAQKIGIAFHEFIAGLFTALYLRRLRTGRIAAFLGGVVYTCCGHMIAKETHVPHLHTAAFLPVLFFFIEGFLRRGRRGDFFGIAATYCLAIFAGYMHVVVLEGIAAGLYGLVHLIAGRFDRRRIFLVMLTGVAIAWGGAMAALQLLPVKDNLGETLRDKIKYREFTSDYLPLTELPLFLFPLVFGGGHGTAVFGYAGEFNLSELTGWIGYLPPMLAVVGFLLFRKGSRRTAAWTWGLVAVLAFALVLGPQTPIHRLSYRIPVYNLFRGAARNMLLLHFAVAVLAGLGAHALIALHQRGDRRFVKWTGALALSLATITAAMTAFALMARAGWGAWAPELWRRVPAEGAPLWLPVSCAASAALLTALWAAVRRPWFLLLCLVPFVFQSVYTKPRLTIRRFTSAEIPLSSQANEITRTILEREGTLDAWRVHSLLFREYHGGFEQLSPSLQLIYPVRTLTGYGPLFPEKLNWMFKMHLTGLVDDLDMRLAENRIFSMMNVRYLTIKARDNEYKKLVHLLETTQAAWTANEDGANTLAYRLVYTSSNGVMLWENLNALPRAWSVERLFALEPTLHPKKPERQAVNWVLDSANRFDPRIEAVYTGQIPDSLPRVYTPATVKVIPHGPNALELDVESAGDAFVVLAEPYYPGWKAFADGVQIRLHPVDAMLTGIEIPSGVSRVMLVYRPPAFMKGVIISFTALIVLIVFVAAWPKWMPAVRQRFLPERI